MPVKIPHAFVELWPSKTDESLNPKQQKFWARDNGNNNSDRYENDPRTPNIYASHCSCYLLSTTVSFIQDSMPLRFLCELKKFVRLLLTLQVLWQCSREISVLYYSLHSWHKFS